MTAKITSMLAFRAKRDLARRSDDWVRDRIIIVKGQLNGWDNPNMQAAYFDMSFPYGFDPDNHPEDNLHLLEAEAERRGLPA